jgi:REP element-mobilizing transposase RayT
MERFTIVNHDVDLSQPSESARGRYWYNLHLVLVVEERWRITNTDLLRTIRDGCLKVAAKKGHLISRLSLLPDHLHIALRPQIEETPLDVVSAYQNNLAFLAGQQRIWCDGFYVGTFSEYTTEAVRSRADHSLQTSFE